MLARHALTIVALIAVLFVVIVIGHWLFELLSLDRLQLG